MNAIVEQPARGTSLVTKFAGKYSVDPGRLLPTLKATAFRLESGQVSDEQMMALLIVSDQYGLNPFTKEIFAYPDKHKGIVPVVSVDGWCRIINDHGAMDGIEFIYGPAKGTHFEWIECVIYRKDRSKPVRVREFWDEVAKTSGPWQSHGNRMHRHKALIQCGRVAFGFGGIYDEDEAKQIIERDITEVSVVEMPKAKEKPGKSQEIVVNEETGEIAAPAGEEASPTGSAAPTEDADVTLENALKPGQVKIIKAKMVHAALTEIDFKTKWGKPLTDGDGLPLFRADQANEIIEWISSKASA